MATLFDLQAVIRLDSNQFENGVKQAEKSGSSLATSLKSGLATAAKVAGAAMGVAAAGVAALTKSAVDSFAEYEQLAGGAAKIFDEMSQTDILRDAQNAYKDLGLSANQYLAVINDVGATFAATMGDAAGYEAAKTGLKAISDYASGTGKNVDELSQKFTLITRSTSSYQSIADQFSGILPATSAGFLEQAQAAGVLSDKYKQLTEVPIEEYQAAVSEMLEKGVADLGLANNTMQEAFSTLSGSLAMTKSAWSNLVTGLADDNADFETLMSNFVDSVVAVGENIIPRIQTTIQGVTQLVSSASATIVPLIVDTLMQNLPALLTAGVDLVFALVNGMLDNIDTVIDSVLQLIDVIVDKLIDNLPKLIEGGVRLIIALAGGLIKAIPQLVKNIPAIIVAIVKGLAAGTSQILEVGKNIVRGIWNGISAMGGWIREKVTGFFNGIVDGVKGLLGIHSPSKVFAGIGENMALGLGEGWNGEFDAVKKSVAGDMDFVGSYTPSVATAKASAISAQATQSNTDTLLTAILDKLDGMGVYLDGTTLTGYIDSSLGRKTEQNKRLALA